MRPSCAETTVQTTVAAQSARPQAPHGIAIVENVGAGPDFVHSGNGVRVPQQGRRTAADDLGIEPFLLESVEHGGDGVAQALERAQALGGVVLDVAGIERHAAPAQRRQSQHVFHEIEQRRPRRHAHSQQAQVGFGQNPDLDARARRRPADERGHPRVVQRHGDLHAPRQLDETRQLRCAHDRIGDQQIGRAGGQHDLAFGGFGDRQAAPSSI